MTHHIGGIVPELESRLAEVTRERDEARQSRDWWANDVERIAKLLAASRSFIRARIRHSPICAYAMRDGFACVCGLADALGEAST